MANTLLVLAQTAPSANTLTDSYTVPSVTSTVVSSLNIVNTHATVADTIRISVAVAGAANNIKQYLYYGLTINAGDTFQATLGLTLATTDVIRVYSLNGTCSFSFFGNQVT